MYNINNNKRNKVGLGFFGIIAFFAMIYSFIIIFPLFSSYFHDDDIWNFDDVVALKSKPFGYLHHAFVGVWWRPLAFFVMSYPYFIFGLNPQAFHWMGWVIHLISALTILLFTRRCFSLRPALISFALYMISPLAVSSVGFVTDTIQDEISTILVFLSFFFSFSREKTLKDGPYFLPAFLWGVALLFKELVLGVLPTLILLDWFLFPKNKFTRRIMRLSPYVLALLLIPLRFLFVESYLSNFSSPLFSTYGPFIDIQNMSWSIILAFAPIVLQKSQTLLNELLLLIPILLIIAVFAFSGQQRSKIIFLLVVFVGMSFALIPAGMYLALGYWLHQWIRMPILVAIAVIMLALICEGIISRVKSYILSLGISSSLIFCYVFLSTVMIDEVKKEMNRFDEITLVRYDALFKTVKSMPPGSLVYIANIKTIPINLINDIVSKRGIQVTLLLKAAPDLKVLHNRNFLTNHVKLIFGNEQNYYIKENYDLSKLDYQVMSNKEFTGYLRALAQDPCVHIVMFDSFSKWKDVTGDYRN